uniref:Uncharacterized protein n=1 Tax=viral metagenome TaxID=1070528 RepID=A0A6M3XPI0_9ZZZZ
MRKDGATNMSRTRTTGNGTCRKCGGRTVLLRAGTPRQKGVGTHFALCFECHNKEEDSRDAALCIVDPGRARKWCGDEAYPGIEDEFAAVLEDER